MHSQTRTRPNTSSHNRLPSRTPTSQLTHQRTLIQQRTSQLKPNIRYSRLTINNQRQPKHHTLFPHLRPQRPKQPIQSLKTMSHPLTSQPQHQHLYQNHTPHLTNQSPPPPTTNNRPNHQPPTHNNNLHRHTPLSPNDETPRSYTHTIPYPTYSSTDTTDTSSREASPYYSHEQTLAVLPIKPVNDISEGVAQSKVYRHKALPT